MKFIFLKHVKLPGERIRVSLVFRHVLDVALPEFSMAGHGSFQTLILMSDQM